MTRRARFFENQGLHLLAWLVAGALLYALAQALPDPERSVWGLTASGWILMGWVLAGMHQGYVWLCWRSELYYGKLSRWFGGASFPLFLGGFYLLTPLRLLIVIPVAIATAGSAPMPLPLSWGLIVLSTPFILWGAWSFLRYFGLGRLAGADHFDATYRTAGLERRGIFRYMKNPAYTVVLLALYHPALVWQSWPALAFAVVQHALVSAHYFSTERPDVRAIYGSTGG